jgi:hypothetical protein
MCAQKGILDYCHCGVQRVREQIQNIAKYIELENRGELDWNQEDYDDDGGCDEAYPSKHEEPRDRRSTLIVLNEWSLFIWPSWVQTYDRIINGTSLIEEIIQAACYLRVLRHSGCSFRVFVSASGESWGC